MKRVSYEEMLRKDWSCILKGDNISKLNKIKRFQNVVNGSPMSFQKINDLLFKHLDPLEYIDFWKDIKIYRVEY